MKKKKDEYKKEMTFYKKLLKYLNKAFTLFNVLDVDELLESAIKLFANATKATYVSIFYYDANKDELQMKKHNHPYPITEKINLPDYKNTIMGIVLENDKPLFISDIERFKKRHKVRLRETFTDRYTTKSCMSIPLVIENVTIGIVNLADKSGRQVFDKITDFVIAQYLAKVLSIGFSNSLLFREVQEQEKIDIITKLKNTRAFFEELEKEINRSRRYKRTFTLILGDIDNFRRINEEYGRLAGDVILEEIGMFMKINTRQVDIIARYGADEFALILPETVLNNALSVIKRIKNFIASSDFGIKDFEYPLTMSFGVMQYNTSIKPADLVKKAEVLLNQAKNKGYNQVECG